MAARYYIEASPELLANVTEDKWAATGITLIARWGPRRKNSETWLIEDSGADPELDGYLIDLSFARRPASDDSPEPWLVGRRIQ